VPKTNERHGVYVKFARNVKFAGNTLCGKLAHSRQRANVCPSDKDATASLIIVIPIIYV
jgi:hypothetical protein